MPANLYRRGPVWWARAQVAGRDLRRSLRTGDRVEAKKRLAKWLEQVSHIAFDGQERATWQAAVKRWSSELPQSVRQSTINRYLVSARQLHPHFSDLYLDQINRRKIAEYVAARRKDGASNATIRRDLTVLSRIMVGATNWGWIERNPSADFDRSLIRERREAIRPPTNDELNLVLQTMSPMLASLLRFLRATGMRLQEAGGLEWPAVDLARGEVQLLRTKTGRPRTLKLTPEAAGTLAGTPRHISSPYVFWHGDGLRYRNLPTFLSRKIKRAKQHFRVHDLRHAFAIEKLQAGWDIYDLSRYLGHSSVKTTEIYLGWLAQNPAQVQRFGTGKTDANA